MFSLAFGIHHTLQKLFPGKKKADPERENTAETVKSDRTNDPTPAVDEVNKSSNASRNSQAGSKEKPLKKAEYHSLGSDFKLDNEAEGPNVEVAGKSSDDVDAVTERLGAASLDASLANVPREASESWEHKIHDFHEFPYFSDPSTIEFIRRSTTMFIMRGLPGSGKSTIVQYLRHLYPETVVCCADDYRLDVDGEYKFDKSKLADTHTKCQEKAAAHCEQESHVVIIDNTNIQRWEMGFYLRLAQQQHYYHTFIVEPRTPWRHDIQELAKRNLHGVDIDILHRKLQQLQGQKIFPMYYGWFLTKKDSSGLVKMAKEILKNSVIDLKLNEEEGNSTKLKDILEDFDICYTDPKGMLHCTSRFIGSNTSHPYHHRNEIQSSIGKVYDLAISGFVYTEHSISARVNLNWEDGKTMLDLYDKDEEAFLQDRYKDHSKSNQILNHFHKGCSAHITIKVSNDAQPKVSGENILKMCEFGFHGKYTVRKIKNGQLHKYPENMFYLHLDKSLKFDSLFHGYFSVGRR